VRVVAFTKTSALGPSSRYRELVGRYEGAFIEQRQKLLGEAKGVLLIRLGHRYFQYRARLVSHGVQLRILPLFGATWFRILAVRFRPLRLALKGLHSMIRFVVRLFQLATLGPTDLVVVEHQLFPYLPPVAEKWLSRSGRRWSLEFDDAIYLTRGHGNKMQRLCALADQVVVGNRFLGTFANKFNGNVHVIPTTIDLDRYRQSFAQRKSRPDEPLVIGWIGLPYNFDALTLVAAPLARLAQEVRLVLRVISAGWPDLDGVTVETRNWSQADEVEQLRQFDIGIMPLVDSEWSRGKCGLKILQYFAAGVPVVASPVGINRDIIEDGRNGFLASDADAWYERLRTLATNTGLRQRLGEAGRATVAASYSVEGWTEPLARVWSETAGAER